jgi:hypothetical protein
MTKQLAGMCPFDNNALLMMRSEVENLATSDWRLTIEKSRTLPNPLRCSSHSIALRSTEIGAHSVLRTMLWYARTLKSDSDYFHVSRQLTRRAGELML